MITELRRGSLLVIFLTVFIDLLGFGMIMPLLPIYAAELKSTPAQLGMLMASFSAMQFLFAPMWGRLSDRIGRRPVIMVGLLGSVVFYALFGVATVRKSIALLFVARIGAGLAGATISTAQAYIADTTTLQQRPRGMALIGMAFGLGFTFGPLVGMLAVPNELQGPGPMPGYLAAGLSAIALALAIFVLPESLHAGSESASERVFNWQALRAALAIPSVAAIVVSIFLCGFSFTCFETTLGLLIKGETQPRLFEFTFAGVFKTFAYIGFVLALVQGGLVRRMAGRVSEGAMALFGAVAEMIGFGLLVLAEHLASERWLFAGLTVLVAGFAFITPSLNSLLSRRSDPLRQGGILGLGQSVSALARILGGGVGIPLMHVHLGLPFIVGAVLMGLGAVCIWRGAQSGRDFEAQASH